MNQEPDKRTDFRNQNFQGQNLKGRNFTDCDLRGAKFTNAILCHADFTCAKLHGADFSGADLKGAYFTEASIKDVSEREINFSGSVNFTGAKIQGTNFAKANLVQANFSKIRAGLKDIPYLVGLFIIVIALCSSFTSTIIGSFTIYYFAPKFSKMQRVFAFSLAFICSVISIVSLRTVALQFPLARDLISYHVMIGMFLIVAIILMVIGTTLNSQDDSPSDTKLIFVCIAIVIFVISLFLSSSLFIVPESSLISYFPKLGLIVKGLGTTTQGKWLAGIAGAIIGGGLGWWFSYLALQGDQRFSWLWKWYVGLAADEGTIFSGADLTDANFTRASLKGAKFKTEPFYYQKIRCQRINWYRAENLEYANIEGLGYLTIPKVQTLVTKRQVQNHSPGDNNFDHLNLEGIYLESATLSGASFVQTNLKAANLCNARLDDANLTSAIFQEANLRDAWLQRATLTNANFQAASLHGVRLDDANLTNANFQAANLHGVRLDDANLTNANFQAANLHSAQLYDANLTKANFQEANLHGVRLERANLTNANLNGTDLTGATLTGACLKNVNIDANTKLDDVQCEYVFLEEFPDPERGIRERLPHDTSTKFGPGEFEKRFRHKHKSGTLQLFISGDNNRSALARAIVQLVNKLVEENKDIQVDDLRRGIVPVDNAVVVEVPVPPTIIKSEVENKFQNTAKSQVRIDTQQDNHNPEFSDNCSRIYLDEKQSLYDFIINLIQVIGKNINPYSGSNPSINIQIMRDNNGNIVGYVGRDFNNNVTE